MWCCVPHSPHLFNFRYAMNTVFQQCKLHVVTTHTTVYGLPVDTIHSWETDSFWNVDVEWRGVLGGYK